MITKRIYAEPFQIREDSLSDFTDQIPMHVVKGFEPIIFKKYKSFNLILQDNYPVSNEEFLTTIDTTINEIFDTDKLPIDYNHKIKFFQSTSKSLNLQSIKQTISEILEKISYRICTYFLECENIKQISDCWCHICKKSNKIEFLIYCLLSDINIIDFFCEKCKNILSFDQKQNMIQIVVQDFEKFDNQMTKDMKEVFDFLCKLEIYSEDFFANIKSVALGYFKRIISEMDQTKLSERFQSLEDARFFVVNFSSFLLYKKDIKRLTCDVNDEFSKLIFEELDKELPNLIQFHQIQDIEIFSLASGSVNKSRQFFELLSLSFSSYAENEMKLSSSDNLFQNLNIITSYLLDLCKILGKKCEEILIPSFRKIINRDPNYIAKMVAIGIDYAFKKHLEFEMSTIFFIFKLLNSKDTFEAYHSNLLMNRIRHNNGKTLLSDLTLTEEIRSYCGDYYTKRFDLLISDAEFSRKCFNAFCNEFYVPDMFNVLILNSKLFTTFSTNLREQNEINKIPADARIISAQYFGFLRDNFPNRKYQWCLHMSEFELKCTNNNYYAPDSISSYEFTVYCNSYCASLLLSFNIQISQTVQEIIEKTNLSVNDVESILSVLTSPKINLIYADSNKFCVNYCPKKSKIKIPSLVTIDSSLNNEKNCEYIIDNRIDCLIAKILKNQKLIGRSDLFQFLIDEIGNQVTEEKFKNRIENMKRKCLLSENELGTISYIP